MPGGQTWTSEGIALRDRNSGDATEGQGPGWQEVDWQAEYNCCVLAKGEGAGPPLLIGQHVATGCYGSKLN